MAYNPQMVLFKRNLNKYGQIICIGETPCQALIIDTNDNNMATDTKKLFIEKTTLTNIYIGQLSVIDNENYFIINVIERDCYIEVVVERYTHHIKVQYPNNYPLLEYDVLVKNTTQSTVSGGVVQDVRVGECIVYIARDDKGKQLQNGTRFYLFNTVYKIISLTWECDALLKCFCKIDPKKTTDNDTTQIADNESITPPKQKFTIISTSGENGTISPVGNVIVEEGQNATFTFTPNTGYEVDTVLVDGASVSIVDSSYTFTNVTANHTISVSFKEIVVVVDAITGDDEGTGEMYFDMEYNFYITNPNNEPCTWTYKLNGADIPQMSVLSQTNRSIQLYCEYHSSLYYKDFTLTATYGSTVLTKDLTLMS